MQKPLSQKDKNRLRKKLTFIAFFAIVVIAIFSMIYFFILKDFSESESIGYMPMIVFGAFALFFASMISYLGWSCIQDINAGVKNCFEGILEDKKLDIRQSTSHGARAGVRRSGNRSSTKRDYYIIVDGIEHKVDFSMYNYVSVGDHIYFEIAPKSNVLLHYEILEEVVSESKHIKRHTSARYPDSKIRKTPLTREDKEALQKLYTQKLRKRLTVIAFIAFPIIGLSLNGLGALLVFLFPLPIALAYQIYKLISFHLKHRKSVNEGRKKLITTQVTDKLFTTVSNSKGKHNKRTLKTTYGSINVSENIYQTMNTGDEITIHEAPYLSYSFGISVDETYYPLL